MIADLSALGYLEYRQLVNRARQIVRQPGRVLLYLVVLGYFSFMTVLRRHGAYDEFAASHVSEPYASALFFAYVTLLGIMMYGAASGIVGAFSGAADARFLSGSAISERIVVLWLQLRRSAAAVARMVFTIILYTIMFARGGALAGAGLSMIGGTLVATVSAIPMLALRAVIGTRTAQSVAGAIAALGILPMMALFASLLPNATSKNAAHTIEHFGAGHAFNALFAAQPLALASLYGFAAVVIALSYASATGLYPELYTASLRVLNFRERRRRSAASGIAIEHRYERRPHRAYAFLEMLGGPWTIVWKEWIALVRSPSMQRLFVFGLIACALVGAVFGQVVAHKKDQLQEIVTLAGMVGNLIVIFVAMGSAIGLADDIAKPLWWIGPDRLWVRLYAWTLATSWRLAACLAAGIATWALTLHAPVVALIGIPLALSGALYLRAIGLALYSLFPSTIDQRGPLAIVRAMLTYLFAAPPAVLAVLVMLLLRSIAGGILTAVVCSLVETILLIAFASSRILRHGIAFARAENG